jgi:general secretion pathway protein A
LGQLQDTAEVYEAFFKFSAKPFAMNPDPEFLYPSDQHGTALTLLDYAMESQAPFCLLTGAIGSGKTTLLRHFIRKLPGNISVGLISNTHAKFQSILPWASAALGISAQGDSETAQYEALVSFFVREYAKGNRTLLIVDEAHNLTTATLEELRLLSNVNSECDLTLQVLLVGQPELRDKLAQPELEQFAQRVAVDFHLSPLTLADVRAYIRHRLGVAGGGASIFTPDAVAFVHARTRGVPRLINQLCDLALVYAFAEQRHTVEVELLQHVLKDRKERGSMQLFVDRPPVMRRQAAESVTPQNG